MARQTWAERIARGLERGLTPSQARGKPKVGESLASAISGAPLRGAAKRSAAAREARRAAAEAPPALSWRDIPGYGRGRYLSTSSEDVARRAIEQAAAEGRQVIIHLYAEAVEFLYPKPHDENEATIPELPAGFVRDFLEGRDTFGGLVELALLRSSKYASIQGVYQVEIKSYP